MDIALLRTIFFAKTPRGWGSPILFWGPPGCLAADTHIAYSSFGPDGRRRSHKGASIERLYQTFHRIPGEGKGRYQIAPADSEFFITSMDDEGGLRRNRIMDVVDSGTKPTFKLRTKGGFEIEATADHPFFVGDKYVQLGDLRVGDTVFVHDNTAERVGEEPRETSGSRKTVYVKAHPNAPKKIVAGQYEYRALRMSRAVVEAQLNNLTLEQYVAKLNDGDIEGITVLSPDQDVHHIDEDFTNDSPANLLVLTRSEHLAHHAAERPLRFVATADMIEEIVDAGDQRVYDIKVAAPYNNFVADGFVVHNCGKTGILEAFASSLHVNGAPMHVETLSPGEAGEGAFGVVPVPTLMSDGTSRITYPTPWWISNFEGDEKDGGPGGRGLVFLDELSSAPPALHPPLLGLIHAGRVGGGKLPGLTRIIGAANPPEMAAAGFDLAPPVANRLGHMIWEPPTQVQWADYMLAQGGNAATMAPIDIKLEEQRVEAAFPAAYARAAGLVTAFLRTRAQHMHAMPATGAKHMDGMRWPSHRSWDNAVRAYASCIIQGTAGMYRDRLIAAFVGDGPTEEFANWVASADLPDPEEVLDGKLSFKHEPHRLDRTLALTSAMSASLLGDTNKGRRAARSDQFWRFVGEMADASATDLVMPGVGAIMKAEASNVELAISTTAMGNKAISKIGPHMKAAGIIG